MIHGVEQGLGCCVRTVLYMRDIRRSMVFLEQKEDVFG